VLRLVATLFPQDLVRNSDEGSTLPIVGKVAPAL